MIKQYLSSISITKYSCSARLYGKIHIGIGLLVVLFIIACMAIEGMPEPIVLIIMSLIAIGILGYGAYFTWLRGKPLKRDITLGSWSNRLYLRSRWLFITAGIITCLAGFAVTIMIVSLISNGYDDKEDERLVRTADSAHIQSVSFLHELLSVLPLARIQGFAEQR